MKLDIPNRKNYKTDNTYINAIYRRNKEIIDKAYEGIKYKRQAFKQQILEKKSQEGLSLKQTIKKELKREIYVPVAERMKGNVITGLRSNKKYQEFTRSLRDQNGKFVKFNKDNLKYIGDNQYSYEDDYGNSFVIDFSNSPKQITIYDLTNEVVQ